MCPIAVDLKDLRRQLKIVDRMSHNLPKQADRELLEGLGEFLSTLMHDVLSHGTVEITAHRADEGDEAPKQDF